MRYKYFLFDWDGTLADSLPVWVGAFKETFKEYGKNVTDREIGEHVIANWHGPSEMGVNNEEAFFASAEKKMVPDFPFVELNPGAGDLLLKIKESGGKIAIVTSSKRAWAEPAMRRLKVDLAVDAFLGKEDVTHYKPDPEILLKAIKEIGGDPEKTVMIGDHKKDIEAAKRAGVESILYFPKKYEIYYDREKQAGLGATFMIDDFEEMRKII